MTAGLPEGPLRARLPALVDRVGLGEAADRNVGGFSTGMRQRLAIALAILRDPPLLILDEPTNGLDPAGVVEVRELIGDLAAAGTTIFLSTHVLTEVEQVCDRVAILDHGRIVTQATTAELRSGGRLRIRFDDAADAVSAMALLGQAGIVGELGATAGVVLLADQTEGGSAILRRLASAGLFPAEVVPERASLESVFLQLTGGAIDGAPSSSGNE